MYNSTIILISVDKSVYTENEARDLATRVLSAIKHCHDKNVVHRDLKPENLLMSSDSNDTEVKLADFGFAAVLEDEGNPNLTECVGTPDYMAPEILSGQPYGKPVDLWAFGVILFILLAG